MLFKLHPDTPVSSVFVGLNNEFLYFLSTSINATEFSRELFTEILGAAVWGNEPTRLKFEDLWQVLPVDSNHRTEIYGLLSMAQNLPEYFSDVVKDFPALDEPIFKAVKSLTKHLFERTKDLAAIRAVCDGESITLHFNTFRRLNGNLCTVCASEELAQVREGVAEKDQWRSAYDHMLDKAKYPAFGIHPANLVPICDTCNGKAKGSKELLVHATGAVSGTRRLGFYPYSECCEENMEVSLDVDGDSFLKLKVSWGGATAGEVQKINAWNEVYQIKARVEGELGSFVTTIANDCRPIDLDDLKNQMARRAECCPVDKRQMSWLFWKTRLYSWICDQGDELAEQLWDMISAKTDERAYQDVYGI